MITPTHSAPRQSWSLALKTAIAVLIAAFFVTLGLLVYVLLTPANDGAVSGLRISSDDPLAVADYHRRGESPRIGEHWHVSYAIYIGDERQPNAPTWEGTGIHTHADGIIHMHPFQPFEEGPGAALNKWFEYGGGELTETSMREPGASTTVHNGDAVPGDGRPGEIYVILNGWSFDDPSFHELDLVDQWIRVPVNYVPRDGDIIRIMFEPEEVMRDHIQNPPSVATETPSPNGDVTPTSGTSPPP